MAGFYGTAGSTPAASTIFPNKIINLEKNSHQFGGADVVRFLLLQLLLFRIFLTRGITIPFL
ncbi:MAG: hypothetical protein GY874_01305 [Desulfobacteraceae bacterium]|nr:hypothetical protein [Desulfobacteraceae bacterium]